MFRSAQGINSTIQSSNSMVTSRKGVDVNAESFSASSSSVGVSCLADS